MGIKGINCPHCSKYIPKEILKGKEKVEVDNLENKKKDLQNLQKQLETEKNNINMKENELNNKEKYLTEERNFIENDLKKKQSKWDMQFMIDIKSKNSIEYYDVIVCIDSILGIESGWKVKYSKKGKEIYEKMKNKELVKVGVVGLRNKGKSWLLQKFLNKDLPKGTSIKTEGLSIKYPNEEDIKNDRNYILLDSAGTEEPLLDNDKKLLKMNPDEALNQLELIAKDKTLTELFLQQFITNTCDILLFVVGVLTYSEQKLLSKIQKILRQKKGYKKLFIIHNLQNFIKVKQIEDYLEEYLKHSATFSIKETIFTKTDESTPDSGKNSKYFVETFKKNNDDDSSLQVYHLIMGNEFDESGKYYNDFAINYLKDHLNTFTNIKSFPVIEEIKNSFIKFSEEAFENQIKENEINIADDLTIRLNKEKKILFKKCFIDEMGFSNFFGSGFEPKYCVTKDNDKINISFEASGKVTKISPESHISNDGYLIFSIIGNKELKLFSSEDKNLKIYENTMKQGDFKFCIKIPISEEIKLENPDEPEFIKGNTNDGNGGIYTFSYNLYKKKQKKLYE